MKKKIAYAIGGTVIAFSIVHLLTGCSTTNISELVKAAGQDTNTISISVRTLYGTVEFQRNQPARTAQ